MRVSSFQTRLLQPQAFVRSLTPTVRHNLRADMMGAVAYGVFFAVALQFIPVVLRRLGASSELLALYTAQTYLGSILTSFSIVLMRRRRTKNFAVACWYLARMIFLLIGFAAHLPWMLVLTAFFWLLEAFPSPAYTRIMQAVYPTAVRGKAMAMVRFSMVCAILVVTPAAGWLLDVLGYRIMFPLAGLFGLLSTWLFAHMDVDEGTLPPRQTRSLAALWAIVLRNRPFALHLLGFTVYGIGALIGFALYPLVQVDRLHLSYTQLGLLAFAQSVTWLLGFSYWGRAVDRFGGHAVLRVNLAIAFLVPLSYAWASAGWMLLPAFVVQGIIAAGVDLGLINTSIQLAEPENVAEYAAIQSTVVGVRGMISPFIGVALLRFGVTDTIVFVAGALLILLSFVIEGLVHPPVSGTGESYELLRWRWPLRFRYPRV